MVGNKKRYVFRFSENLFDQYQCHCATGSDSIQYTRLSLTFQGSVWSNWKEHDGKTTSENATTENMTTLHDDDNEGEWYS